MTLYVETFGRGPDLVLLHGWGMNGAVWRNIAPQFTDDYCVHLVDLPGHGKSDMQEPYTLDGLVCELDAAFPLPVHVIGWSLGGAVALHWAAQNRDKLHSLTMVASTPCFAQREDWQAAMPIETLTQFTAQLATDWRGTLKRFIALQAMGDADAKIVARALTQDLFSHGEPPVDALEKGLAILRDADLRAQVGTVHCPVLLQYGDKDMLTKLGAAQWLAHELPQARLVVHPGAGHAPFISHAADFVAEQKAFLGSI